MLLYHSKNDTYHCIYRMLSIITILWLSEIQLLKLRIIDFYVLFPGLLVEVPLPRVPGASSVKKSAGSIKHGYERLPASTRLFSELSFNQSQAVNILRAKDIVTLTEDVVKPSDMFLCGALPKVVSGGNLAKDDFLRTAIKILGAIELYGNSGLKARSNLVEARYDVF